MESHLEVFKQRLYDEWLPDFCDDEKRNYSYDGFKSESIIISEFDAGNFARALDSSVVKDSGGGRYFCSRSNAFEQIFWNGRKSIVPRPLTLWVEPVITIGTMARLGLDYGWPESQLCMQSKDWAFDFAVYKEESIDSEVIAGEVKKTDKELDDLINDLIDFSRLRTTRCDSSHTKKINSFKKWTALLKCNAPLFWAVGPNDFTHLFEVTYDTDHLATFEEVQLDKLYAPDKH